MKKFLLTALGCVAALASYGQAPDLYMVGSGGPGLSWTPPGYTLSASDNTYTYKFNANAQPEFKVSVNKSSTWDGANNYNQGTLGVSNNQQNGIDANIRYKCTINSNTNNIKAPAKDDYTLYIEYEDGTYYLTLKTASGEAPTITYPEKVYVPGASAGWGVNANYVLTRQNETLNGEGAIVYTGTVPLLNGEFKIAEDPAGWSGLNFGAGATPNVTLGTPVEAVSGSTTNFKITGPYNNATVTFKYVPAGKSTVTVTADSGVVYPDNLYILGEAGDNGSFSPDKGIPATKVDKENGVYTFTGVSISGNFSFTSMLGSNSNAWDAIKPYRYAATKNGETIAVGNSYTISQENVDNSFNGSGNFDLTVSLKEMKLTVAASSVTPADVTMYVVGNDVNGIETWSIADDNNKMTYENGNYVWRGERLGPNFKFNNGGWSNANYNIGAGENQVLTLGQAFDVFSGDNSANIQLEGKDVYIENPVITLTLGKGSSQDAAGTLTVTGTLKSEAFEPTQIKFTTDLNDVTLTTSDNNIFTATQTIEAASSVTFNIEAVNANGIKQYFGPEANQNDVYLSAGTPEVLNLKGNAGAGDNWNLMDFKGGEVTFTVDWAEQTLTILYEEPKVEPTTVTFYVVDGEDDMILDEPEALAKMVNIWNMTDSESVAVSSTYFKYSFTKETELRIQADDMEEWEVVVTPGEYNDASTYELTEDEGEWHLTLQPGSEDQEFTIAVYVKGQVPGKTQNVQVNFNVDGVADAASKFEAYYYGYVNEELVKQVIDVTEGVSVPANTNITLEPKEGYVLDVKCYNPNGTVSEPSDALGEWNVTIEAGDPVMLNVTVSTAPANVSINFATNSAGAMPSNYVNVSTQPDINFIVTGNENSLVIPSDGVTLTVTPTNAYIEDGDEYLITSVVVTKDDVEVPAADYADYGVTLTGDMEEWVLSLTTEADGLVFTFYVETSEYVGVNSLNAVDKDAVIYNLQGVRVNANNLSNGIYIINGKKVLVK